MVRRSPRRHKVREYGREKPTGGKTGVREHPRGRGGESRTSDSAGGRAQVRMSFWETRRAKARAKKAALVAKKKKDRKASLEAVKRKGGAVLDHALGVEPDVYREEKAEDKDELI